jgi:hypothetical protein
MICYEMTQFVSLGIRVFDNRAFYALLLNTNLLHFSLQTRQEIGIGRQESLARSTTERG